MSDPGSEPKRRTRADHVRWCKQRAREYLQTGDIANARASMLSDLGKHPETAEMLEMAFMMSLFATDKDGMSRFIEGFAE